MMFGRRKKLEKFAEWVARELFPDGQDFAFDPDEFATIACKKLEQLGYVGTTEIGGHQYYCLKETM